MPPRRRLDAELVRRKLARSREHAGVLIAEGRVLVNGAVAHKAATALTPDVAIIVKDTDLGPSYVSRGGHKLAGALTAFSALQVEGRVCLDAGASTGGFTDVLLRAGARRVVAVDVGYGQLAWSLRSDDRVQVVDRVNVRQLSPELLADHLVEEPIEVMVGDLSFISLCKVMPALLSVMSTSGDVALMVKPQFEVGKDRVGKGGVVRDPELRAEAVCAVMATAAELGWCAQGVRTSPLPGPAGNVEFFVWLRAGRDAHVTTEDVLAEALRSAEWSAAGERVDP